MVEINIYPREPEFEYLLDLYPVQPANRFLPQWYKEQKISKDRLLNEIGFNAQPPHAKVCPAIQEEILNGFILPAWSDIQVHIKYGEILIELPIANKLWNNKIDTWKWISHHPAEQIKGIDLNTNKEFGIFKLMSPYHFVTSPGYGIAFRPMPYHFQSKIKLLPGMVETDIWHEVNFPFEFTDDIYNIETKYIIEAGEPLALISPYKKSTKSKIINHLFNEDIHKKQYKNSIKHFSQSNEWKEFKSYAEEE